MVNHSEIPFGYPWIDESDKKSVLSVLESPILTHGPKGAEFEMKFMNFIKEGCATTTSSCMASLHLASMYFLKPGDEVLVPAQTHVATVHAIELVGATPIFVDCELITGNIDINQLKNKINKKTKAISVVHFVGIPVAMDEVCKIAKEHNLIVIEDCALALGAFYKNKHVGLWGNLGCFSFYPAKHITTGEGGMLISRDKKVVDEIAAFRAFNVDRPHSNRLTPGIYDVIGVGLNYRMSELQAALGCTQMDKLPENLERRSRNFTILKNELLQVEGVHYILDSQNPDCQNSYYCLIVLLESDLIRQRNNILQDLKVQKIGCSVYYPHPVLRLKYYADKYKNNLSEFPNATRISDGSIAFPVGPHLNEKDMYVIAQSLQQSINAVMESGSLNEIYSRT